MRGLAAVVALGLICALGAASASGITPAPGTPAYKRLADKICHCKIPERYRFRVGGTTNFWVVTGGGTETWSMRGVLRRHRRRVPGTKPTTGRPAARSPSPSATSASTTLAAATRSRRSSTLRPRP